jgi:FkbM family methyltransferase
MALKTRSFSSVASKLMRLRDMCLVPRKSRLTLKNALRRWRHKEIASVIDVGASDGRWSRQAMQCFPHAKYLLIEAQAEPHAEALREFEERHANVDVVLAAAGDREGEIHFDASSPLGGQASETPFAENSIAVPMVTIDSAVRARGLKPPYLLKLDTHGFEQPIFEGAAETLRQANLVIVEAYNFRLSAGCLKFHELCGYLEAKGFRCLDLFDVMHRPGDGALWQFDLAFAPAGAPEFESNEFE